MELALDTASLAAVVGVLATIDTLAPTPEDVFFPLGYTDEVTLWSAAFWLSGQAMKGNSLQELVSWWQPQF